MSAYLWIRRFNKDYSLLFENNTLDWIVSGFRKSCRLNLPKFKRTLDKIKIHYNSNPEIGALFFLLPRPVLGTPTIIS